MKTALRILFLSIALSASASLQSCKDEDVVWDVWPACFHIQLVDSNGELINPAYEAGRELYDQIRIVYDGETYSPHDKQQSRAIPAFFDGLYYTTIYYNEKPSREALVFGEFPRDESYTMTFEIIWPDGSSSDMKYKNKFGWKHGSPNINATLWADGKKQNAPYVITYRLDQ